MKKMMAKLLVVAMALSLGACGSKTENAPNEVPVTSVTESSAVETTETSAEESTEASVETPTTPVVYDGGYDLYFNVVTALPSGAELFSLNMFNQAGLNPENGWWGDPESRVIAGNEKIYMQHLTLIENAWKSNYGFTASQTFVCGIPDFEWYNDTDAENPALIVRKPEGSEGYYTLIIKTPLTVDAAESIGWAFDEDDQAVCREALACLLSVFSTDPMEIADAIIEDLYGEKNISDSEFMVIGDAGVKFDSSSHIFTEDECYSVYYIKAK